MSGAISFTIESGDPFCWPSPTWGVEAIEGGLLCGWSSDSAVSVSRIEPDPPAGDGAARGAIQAQAQGGESLARRPPASERVGPDRCSPAEAMTLWSRAAMSNSLSILAS